MMEQSEVNTHQRLRALQNGPGPELVAASEITEHVTFHDRSSSRRNQYLRLYNWNLEYSRRRRRGV
jgi:hypothetical protein